MESTVSVSKAVFFFAAKNIPTGTPGVIGRRFILKSA